MANASTGWRRLPQPGNAGHGLTATATLPLGTYYGSVQAVDAAFATEGSFEIAPARPGYDHRVRIADQQLAFADLWRQVGGTADTWSEVWLQNTAGTAGVFTVQSCARGGRPVGDAWAIAVPALGSLHLDLKEGGDLPPQALTALGADFRGSLVVTPGAGLSVVGAAGAFQPGEGCAAGYAGSPVP